MINIVNNTNQTILIFHLYEDNALQIGVIYPNKSILRNLKKGKVIQINSVLQYKNIIVPSDIIRTTVIQDQNFILI